MASVSAQEPAIQQLSRHASRKKEAIKPIFTEVWTQLSKGSYQLYGSSIHVTVATIFFCRFGRLADPVVRIRWSPNREDSFIGANQ